MDSLEELTSEDGENDRSYFFSFFSLLEQRDATWRDVVSAAVGPSETVSTVEQHVGGGRGTVSRTLLCPV